MSLWLVPITVQPTIRYMNSGPLPYEPPTATLSDIRNPIRLLSVLLKLLAGASVMATILIFATSPNLEEFFREYAPWHSMPDAFDHLNGTIPIFMLFMSITLVLLNWIDSLRRPVLAVPALAGPTMAVVGWLMTADLGDPNWFELFALTTIGLFVSGLVTFLLTLVVVAREYWGE